MGQKFLRRRLCACMLAGLLFFSSCGGGSSGEAAAAENTSHRESVQQCRMPEASGTVVYGEEPWLLDTSHTEDGYVMVSYSGSADKIKVRITYPDDTQYIYPMKLGEGAQTFPLTGGDGSYTIDLLEHTTDSQYAIAFSQEISVKLADEFEPFLYPNQYVWFTQSSKAAVYAKQLSDQASDDLNFVELVYNYVIGNITYDQALADSAPTTEYIPDVDETFTSGRGICFDYAALMTAMLRSQDIPTKLVVGYSGEAYHAWISVYLEEQGWVDNVIEFDGKSWSLMDPTLAANNDSSAVKKYVGDGSNYTEKYCY